MLSLSSSKCILYNTVTYTVHVHVCPIPIIEIPYLGGSIPWAKVALEMGNRTDAMCSFRWRSLSSTPDIVNQFASRVAEKALTKNAHISASVSHCACLSSCTLVQGIGSEYRVEHWFLAYHFSFKWFCLMYM